MMDSKAFTGALAGTGLTATGLALSVTELTAILSLVSTGLGLIIMIVTGIVIPMIKWYKKAKADGKITADEVEEAANIVKDGAEKLKDEINKNHKE